MNKEYVLQYLHTAMSLRDPQKKSLDIFAGYLESDAGQILLQKMKGEHDVVIEDLEKKSKEYFQQTEEGKLFESFDGRAYPSFTYALATGVGKTRLMGAFVAYLYLVHEIQHFLIVAPGNTIYRKLVEDFSQSNNPKYVFRGIEELNSSTVKIITKDNYGQSQMSQLFKNKIEINILNVQQFAQKDIEKEKGITKGSELFGVEDGKLLSYFDYLASLHDLVVLLDESHHYHAMAAFASLDRLDPLVGLEFTATPYTGEFEGRGQNKTPKMKGNIVYLYNLGDAIRDGYVKDPWVGTEADVDFGRFEVDSLDTDMRKLQLAVYFHERARTAIKEYALENDERVVKPVMLVVAKDIEHARELKAKIDSDDFHGGDYKGKVLEIHTKLRGEESEIAIEQLISLEKANNYIEIVIHVNMLKEGWDVANIFTIVPLRASAAQVLTEQTLGRGLRLPYFIRTGHPLVDRVIVVAHGEFSRIIAEARDSSLIQPSNIEKISEEIQKQHKTILEVKSIYEESVGNSLLQNVVLQKELQEKAAKELSSSFTEETPEEVKNYAILARTKEYESDIIKTIITNEQAYIGEEINNISGLFSELSDSAKSEIQIIKNSSQELYKSNHITIPRIILTPNFSDVVFKKFSIDEKKLPKYLGEINVIEEQLQKGKEETLFGSVPSRFGKKEITNISSFGGSVKQKPENTLIASLISEPLVDYDSQKEILNDIAVQVINSYRKNSKDERNLAYIIETHAHEIAHEVYNQMRENMEMIGEGYETSNVVAGKSYLEQYNISMVEGERKFTLESQVDVFNRSKIYTGFTKACHSAYKFDSSDEARFAYILEGDSKVITWLRPAPRQFEGLYWRDENGDASHMYEPDFVVELENEIIMVEVKPLQNIEDFDVQAKKITSEKFCEIINKNIGEFGINKKWKYIIVSTEKITITSTMQNLLTSS